MNALISSLSSIVSMVVVTPLILVGGCASQAITRNNEFVTAFSQSNMGVTVKAQQSAQDMVDAREAVKAILQNLLTGDDAVRVALLSSPTLQAMLAESAIMSANATQSAQLSNPVFRFERLMRKENGVIDLDIGRALSVALLDILFLPSRLQSAEAMQSQARIAGATSVVETAANARAIWVRAVAAEQSLRYFEQVMDLADAGAELAKRMYTAGNFSKLQRARQQAFYADAYVQHVRAKQTAVSTREELIRVLGLDIELATQLKLAERLPDLPKQLKAEIDVNQTALAQRLDVQMADSEVKALETQYASANLLKDVHVVAMRNSETGRPSQRGYEIEVPLPIFDFGDTRRSKAQAEYAAAIQRARQTRLNATSTMREQYAATRAAYDIATHYRDEVVPLRKFIAEEVQLKYNGSLASVFDLLAETRVQISSIALAIDAQRDYWLADAALQASLLGKPMSTSPSMRSAASTQADSAGH